MQGLELLAIVTGAALTILLFTGAWVRMVEFFRRREYASHRRIDSGQPIGVSTQPLTFPPAFVEAREWLRPHHQLAIDFQTRYYDSLTRSISALALALLGVLLSVTVYANEPRFSTYASVMEALAFVYVLYQFFAARRANRYWVRARTQAELLRQAGILVAAGAASEGRSHIEAKEKGKWEAAAQQVAESKDIVEAVQRYWQTHQLEFAAYVAKVTEPAMQAYLALRPQRQLRWFTDANARLRKNYKRRKIVLALIFCACVMIAVLKLLLNISVLNASSSAKSWVIVLLFLGTAWASGYTTFYLSNNQRSLFHRYSTQLRYIRSWLREPDKTRAEPGILVSSLEASQKILEFESLMIQELVDWIHISSHDVMELSP